MGQVKLLLTPNIRPVPFFGVWRQKIGTGQMKGNRGQVLSDLVRGTARIPGLRRAWNKLGTENGDRPNGGEQGSGPE